MSIEKQTDTKITKPKTISNNKIINRIWWFLSTQLWIKFGSMEDFLDKSWYKTDTNKHWFVEKCIFVVPESITEAYSEKWRHYDKNLKLRFILILNGFIYDTKSKQDYIGNTKFLWWELSVLYKNTEFIYFDLIVDKKWKYTPKVIHKEDFFRRQINRHDFDVGRWRLYFSK